MGVAINEGDDEEQVEKGIVNTEKHSYKFEAMIYEEI